jgi:hypothetical protein
MARGVLPDAALPAVLSLAAVLPLAAGLPPVVWDVVAARTIATLFAAVAAVAVAAAAATAAASIVCYSRVEMKAGGRMVVSLPTLVPVPSTLVTCAVIPC